MWLKKCLLFVLHSVTTLTFCYVIILKVLTSDMISEVIIESKALVLRITVGFKLHCQIISRGADRCKIGTTEFAEWLRMGTAAIKYLYVVVILVTIGRRAEEKLKRFMSKTLRQKQERIVVVLNFVGSVFPFCVSNILNFATKVLPQIFP